MSKIFKLIVPLLLIAVFMVSTYSVVAEDGSPDSGDHNGVSSEQEQQDHRQVQLEYSQSDKSIQIQSENSANGTSNHIQIELSAKEGLKVSFEFSGEVNHSETSLHIGLEARQVVEFIDSNTAVPGFDVNDSVINTYDLRNANWTLQFGNTTTGNDTVWNINATAPIGSGQVEFQFLLTNGYALQADGNTLAPNSLKWSVVFSNYSYDSSSTQLALKMTLKSGSDRSGFESDHYTNQTEDTKDGLTHNNESAVNFGNTSSTSAQATGFFSWADTYVADGVNNSVVTSPSLSVDSEDGTQNQMYFSFVQANNINWDPKVGVDRTTSSSYVANQIATSTSLAVSSTADSSQSPSAPGFEFIALIIAFGGMAVFSKKHLKR